jgi:antitoxin (DNA-binding transcriptional repressor) of toxin-antitoxin stability system
MTATLRELRHNFATVEKAARRGPVEITRRGKLIGTYTAAPARGRAGKWTPPDFTARGIRTERPVDVRDFIG